MKRSFVVSGVLVVTFALAGCGENPVTPTPGQSPFITGQFAGTWSGATVPVRVSGGECVGADLRASAPGLDQGTVTLTQIAADVKAVIRSETTGLTCQYDGSASLTGFAATAVSCDAEIVFQCSNGQSRLLRPVGSTFTATQNGITATGTVTTSYNIFSPATGTAGRDMAIAGMTIESQFTATRR
jgi:hypothetical protein